jgi:penicillin-binding protein 1B
MEKTWTRKLNEMVYTLILEQKLSKEQIFEYYINYVPLGWRGGFNIFGLGEASQAYLGKDLRDVSVAEAALLAGLIQRPSATNPFLYPDKAKNRRNIVLRLMKDNDYINEQQMATAAASEIKVARQGLDTADASYFVDLVNDFLQQKYPNLDFQDGGYRIFTSIDLDLQQDAAESVRIAMKEVDEAIARRHKKDPKAKVPRCKFRWWQWTLGMGKSKRWSVDATMGRASWTALWRNGSQVPFSSRSFMRLR